MVLVRIINSARVLDDQICYDIKDANHIYDLCAARFKLHKSIYNHKAGSPSPYISHNYSSLPYLPLYSEGN